MKRLYYAIASLALLLAGCTEDDTFRQYEQVSSFSEITVTADDLANTRVYINDNRKAVWEVGDTICVYSDIEGAVPFGYSSGNTFKATKAIKGNKFYAFYPYKSNDQSVYVDEANKLHLYVPGNGKFPMAAQSTNNQFVFKHTMGIVHFTVKNIAKILGVTLIANNEMALWGKATIDMTAENPILIMDDQSMAPDWTPWNTTASITFKEGVELKDGEALDVYLPVPVGTYSKGFKVEFDGENAAGEYIQIIKNTDKSLTVERASMNNYTELDLYGELAAEQAKERDALIAIYNALDGDNWENNENWCTDKPLNEWYGVGMDGGHVVSIDGALNYNNANGDIPAELGDLTHLQRLQLYGAQGITSLPKEIGKLDRVWAMSIYGSSITSLPDEIGDMRYLSSLYLSGMPIKTLPKGLANSLNLTVLGIYDTQLETLPDEFALAKLKTLDLSYNQLTTLPEGLTNNRTITSLTIYEGGIQQLPATIGNMSNLETLNISCYNLTSLPAELGNLTNLTNLSIHHTSLNCNLPAELGNLKNLQVLDLSHNEFTGTIPASYGDLSNLAILNITENNMSGEISKTILNSSMWAHLSNAYINPQHNEEGLTFEGGEVAVSKITLDRTSVTTSREGAPITFNRDDKSIKVTLDPANATNKNLYVEIPGHEHHGESIVELNYDGNGFYLSGGVKAGIETVTVRVEGSNAFAKLEVTNKGIAFNKDRVRMYKGDTFTNQFTQYGDEPITSWYTDGSNIIQVDAHGKVTALDEGNAWIYAVVQGVGTFSYEVNVIGKEVGSGNPEEFNRDTDGEWD